MGSCNVTRHRARDIRHESDAQDAMYSLRITTLIAPGRYLVADNRGDQFWRRFTPKRPPSRYGIARRHIVGLK